MAGTVLCRLSDIGDPGGRGFTFGEGAQQVALFVVRQGERAFAYVNECPHARSPLDWMPDQFLDPTRTYIQCSTHGAKFRITDGYCVSGPCTGDALRPISIAIRNGDVVIAEG
jgi:nitrite reductase/ring-hydroxylating ferredoxin subunit